MAEELKIGEVREYNGKKYVAKHGRACKMCAFFMMDCSCLDVLGPCLGIIRKDGLNIIFTEVK